MGDARSTVSLSFWQDFNCFSRLERKWKDLFSRQKFPNHFTSWEWMSSWWDSFSGNAIPHVIGVEAGGTLLAVMPLMAIPGEKETFSLETLGNKFIVSYGTPVLAEEKVVGSLVKFLSRGLSRLLDSKEWNRIVIKGIDQTTTKAFEKIFVSKELKVKVESYRSSATIRLTGEWEQFWQMQPPAMRRSVKKGRDNIKSQSLKLNFYTCKSFGLRDKEWLEITRIYKRSKFYDEAGPLSSNVFPFWERFFSRATESGILEVILMLLNDRPAAFSIGIKSKHKYTVWLLDEDPNASLFSPARLLIAEIFKRLYKQNKKICEISPYVLPYFPEFNTRTSELYLITAGKQLQIIRDISKKLRERVASFKGKDNIKDKAAKKVASFESLQKEIKSKLGNIANLGKNWFSKRK